MNQLPLAEPQFDASHITMQVGRFPEDEKAIEVRAQLTATLWELGAWDEEDAMPDPIGEDSIAHLHGAIFNLAHYSSPLHLESGGFSSNCEYEAVEPFYKGEDLWQRTLDRDLVKNCGGKKTRPRIFYSDRVTIHPQIASRNLGGWFCREVYNLVFDLIEPMPVVAFLGSYDKHRSGKGVVKYFESFGFQPLSDSSWFLHPANNINCDVPNAVVRQRGRLKKIE